MLVAMKDNVMLIEYSTLPVEQRDRKVRDLIKKYDRFQHEMESCCNCFVPTSVKDLVKYDGLCYTCIQEELNGRC